MSNLSQSATIVSLRELFASCGDVLDVEFAAARGASDRPSAAYITMGTPRGAEKAAHDLQGRMHGDRLLMVTRIFGDPDRARSVSDARPSATDPATVTLTQQYRDRHALTYELSCAGGLLTLRFLFPPDDAHDWQVEARVVPGSQVAVTASAPTRERAFRALAEAWSNAPSEPGPGPDWEKVAAALRAVRAM